jgi:hypothetical protein
MNGQPMPARGEEWWLLDRQPQDPVVSMSKEDVD